MNDTTRTPAIVFTDISFSYDTHEVLSHVNLIVNKGDYLAIVGPNGAGKTTLIKLLFRVLAPTSGEVRIFDTPSARWTSWSKIGYVPQHVNKIDLTFPATVLDVVTMGGYGKRGIFHRTTRSDRDAAARALERVGLSEIQDRMIGDLSGGQTQRVFIARALVTHPDILVLDEPTAGIDPVAQESLYALLRELHTQGVTLIVISHDIEVITKESTKLAFVDKTLTYYDDPLAFTKEGSLFLHGHDH